MRGRKNWLIAHIEVAQKLPEEDEWQYEEVDITLSELRQLQSQSVIQSVEEDPRQGHVWTIPRSVEEEINEVLKQHAD